MPQETKIDIKFILCEITASVSNALISDITSLCEIKHNSFLPWCFAQNKHRDRTILFKHLRGHSYVASYSASYDFKQVGKLFQDFISCSWDIAPLWCPTTASHSQQMFAQLFFGCLFAYPLPLPPPPPPLPVRAAFNFSPCRNNKPEEGKRSLGPFTRRGREKNPL